MYKGGGFNFKLIGNFNIESLKNKVLSLTDYDWNEYSKRQDSQSEMYKNVRSPHEETRTIPLLFNERFGDIPDKWRLYSLFEDEINQIKEYFKNYYGGGNSPRIIITKLFEQILLLDYILGSLLKKIKISLPGLSSFIIFNAKLRI